MLDPNSVFCLCNQSAQHMALVVYGAVEQRMPEQSQSAADSASPQYFLCWCILLLMCAM